MPKHCVRLSLKRVKYFVKKSLHIDAEIVETTLMFFLLLLVSHLRLSQWTDYTAEGWLKLFYCHNTLPVAENQLFLQLFYF